jgi:ABC-type sugar transport system ATPase subunit
VYVDRLRAEIKDPKEAMKLGIAYVAENRIEEGLFGNLNIFDNIAIQSEVQHKPFLMHSKKQRHLLKKYLTKMNLCPSITSQSPSSLSSGNQQKLLLLRSFLTGAKVFLFDEPTKGIDISTKLDIYNIMNDLTRKGAAIILISSDFEELKGMCDRLLVLKDGAISGEIAREDISYEAIYRYASI